MKPNPIALIALFLLCGIWSSAQEGFSGSWRVYTGVQALGVFNYLTPATGYSTFDPLVAVSGEAEYQFLDVGVGAYFEFRSHRWRSIGASDPLIARLMGAPGFAIGAMAFWHFIRDPSPFDVMVAAGVGCNFYFPAIDAVQPGLDLSVDAAALYSFNPGFSLGPRFCLRRSSHAGGIPDPDGSGGTLLPYVITDYSLGIVGRFKI